MNGTILYFKQSLNNSSLPIREDICPFKSAKSLQKAVKNALKITSDNERETLRKHSKNPNYRIKERSKRRQPHAAEGEIRQKPKGKDRYSVGICRNNDVE